VLQDGAAAQYGSDAIGGVVNIILKTPTAAARSSATGGQYFEGDGDTAGASFNKGFNLDDRGFINFTFEERYHDFSRQGGADQRFSNPNGTLKPGTVRRSTDQYSAHARLSGHEQHLRRSAIQCSITASITPATIQQRRGVLQLRQLRPPRDDSAYENYRKPDKVSGVTAPSPACPTGCTVYPLPFGFSPREADRRRSNIPFTAGFKGHRSWAGVGICRPPMAGTTIRFHTLNSANAQLFPVLQAQSTTPIGAEKLLRRRVRRDRMDQQSRLSRDFAIGLASPLNVAFGGEASHETFSIGAGRAVVLLRRRRPVVYGLRPDRCRRPFPQQTMPAYIDLAATVLPGLYVDLAGRFEHYSDFGDATVGKATARYDFIPRSPSAAPSAPAFARRPWRKNIIPAPTSRRISPKSSFRRTLPRPWTRASVR
jgi:iron complex outermembrane receptor protein